MKVSAKRMAVLRDHIRAEIAHNMDSLLAGMTPDCFNDVVGVPKPFAGPEQTAERYRRHWEGFPDFAVRVRRVLCADENCVAVAEIGASSVTERVTECMSAKRTRTVTVRPGRDFVRSLVATLSAR